MLSELAKEVNDKGFEAIKKELMQKENKEVRNRCPYRRITIEKMNLREYSKRQLIRIIDDLQRENDYLRDVLGWIE